ncbi:hypothetical protein [Arenimonas sp. GDDSR-1]|uniref:hypothetical protein n=1 Tax=Arenimonas sp. GDDSR-1 TaxID=2950125 RepID=UPI00262FC541|nr:hypothetical protein [Arenimonas sp. GDDSR-1]
MKHISLLAIALISLSLGACSSTMKAVKPDVTGSFPTKDALKPEEILVNEPLPLADYRRLAFIQAGDRGESYEDFIQESVSNIGFFQKVLNKQGFEQELITSGKSDSVSNISDLIGLRQAAKAYGPFLVVRTNVEWLGGYDYTASIEAIDPVTGRTHFHAKRKAFNWAGLDKPLFYPLFNGFLSWVNANKQAPAASAPAQN